MKRAAIGVRMHSGWGALVAVSISGNTVEIVERRHIAVIAPGAAGAKQPYHFAKNLDLADAESFIGSCFAASKCLALAIVRNVTGKLLERQYRVADSAVILASGRAQPPLSKILGSHAAIHAAEGEFFRKVFSQACEDLEIAVTGIRERDLQECAETTFGKAVLRIQQQLSALGRSLGPPWTTDQKTAALAALIVLEVSKADSAGRRDPSWGSDRETRTLRSRFGMTKTVPNRAGRTESGGSAKKV
jgi:hypothetical protein